MAAPSVERWRAASGRRCPARSSRGCAACRWRPRRGPRCRRRAARACRCRRARWRPGSAVIERAPSLVAMMVSSTGWKKAASHWVSKPRAAVGGRSASTSSSVCRSSAIWSLGGDSACTASLIDAQQRRAVGDGDAARPQVVARMLMVESQRSPSARYSSSHLTALSRMKARTLRVGEVGARPPRRALAHASPCRSRRVAGAVAVPADERPSSTRSGCARCRCMTAMPRACAASMKRLGVVGRAVGVLRWRTARRVVAPGVVGRAQDRRHDLDGVDAEG